MPFEIIFSDDGSEDNTISILESWKNSFEDKCVKVQIIKNTHKGPGHTRNVGIKAAQGNWISFLDSDDLWKSNKIKRILEEIENCDGVNFIEHWEERCCLDGSYSLLANGSAIKLQGNIAKQLYQNCHFSTSATTICRSLLEKIGGFDNSFPSAQDYELWLRLSPYIKPVIIEEVLGYYIERTGNITSRPYYRKYLPILRILFRHWRKGGFFLLIYRVLRITITPQWNTKIYNFLKNK